MMSLPLHSSGEHQAQRSLDPIISGFIDELNAGAAPSLPDYVNRLPDLTAAERAKLQSALWFLIFSDATFSQYRERIEGDAALSHDECDKALLKDLEQDWLMMQGRLDHSPMLLRFPTVVGTAAGAPAAEENSAFENDLAWQLAYAHWRILLGRVGEGLEVLGEIAAEIAEHGAERVQAQVLYRLPYLYGLTHLRVDEPARARLELEAALRLVEPHSAEEIRVRDLLGAALTLDEQPAKGYREHQQCLEAVHRGLVRDFNLRASIYRNAADDQLALNEVYLAISHYYIACEALRDTADKEAEAAVYLGLGKAHRELADYKQAYVNFWRARQDYQVVGSAEQLLLTTLEIAETMIEQGRIEAARQELLGAGEHTPGADRRLLSRLERLWALIELQVGDLTAAMGHASASRQLAEAAGEGDQSVAIATQVSALHTAALVLEQTGGTAAADELFARALELVDKTSLLALRGRLARSYADVQSARGNHVAAVDYYRQALRCRYRSYIGADALYYGAA